jgi:hypothetical protein
MDESVIQRIEKLERSARRWKVVVLVLAAILLGFSLTGTFFFVRIQAMRAIEAEREARRAVEAQVQKKKE